MLIDGGGNEPSEFEGNRSGRIRLAEYLAASDVDHIDVMVSTHTHEDHLCGLYEAAKLYPPKQLWQTLPADKYRSFKMLDTGKATNPPQDKFMHALNDYISLCELTVANGGAIRTLCGGDCETIADGISVEVLAPGRERLDTLEAQMDGLYEANGREDFLEVLNALDGKLNNYSLILKIIVGEQTLLLPGDTNKAGFSEIASNKLKADFFKVGHHGQIDGVDEALAAAVSPKAVLCCASDDRRYNSAHPVSMGILKNVGAELYFSDCPEVDGVKPAPHHAVEFTFGNGSEIVAEYK
ncbi:MAG: hypothetical protein MJ099_01895 [Clostridia bacterium]|nr:hypothetical protein [Clostridia bacterium]